MTAVGERTGATNGELTVVENAPTIAADADADVRLPDRLPLPAATPRPDRTRRRRRSGPAPTPRPALPPAQVLLSGALAGLAVLCVAFAGYLFVLSPLQAARSQHLAEERLRAALPDQTVPVSGPIDVATPVALVEIPVLGVHQVLLEGTTSSVLMQGVGHRRDTPLPGQPGVAVVLGRRATFGGPFGDIGRLRRGDVVRVTTGQGLSEFRVYGSHFGTDFRAPTVALPDHRLQLVTSDGPLTPHRALVVDAALATQPRDSGGTAVPVSADEINLHGESGALTGLVLWGQLLLLATVAGCALWWWRGPVVAVAIAAPIALALSANVFDHLVRLLPNTL